jgi:putative heme-binding domain-containing protein
MNPALPMRRMVWILPASFTRGKVAFDNFCSKCHQFDGRGQTVGPPLDGAGRDIDYILANVIDPNRVIGAPYFLRTATRLDGRVEQGILAEEDDRSITLKVEQGQLRKILKSELDGAVKVQEKSMMPEGLTAGMTPADFRDLVRYVMANPFVTRVTLNGQPVTAGVTGKIPLPNKAGPVTIQFQVESTAAMKTKLLLGCTDGIEVRQGETVIGRTGSAPRRPAPDMDAIDVTLPQGVSKFTLTVQHKGAGEAVYLRFADPERRLKYEE